MEITIKLLTCYLLTGLCLQTNAFAEIPHWLVKKTHDDGISFPYTPPKQHLNYLKTLDKKYLPYMNAQPAMIEAWQDDRFGVFIHWDHSSQVPVSMSWGRKGARPHHSTDGKVTNGIPEQEYNDLAKTFNPVKFNAIEWMDVIEAAGAKYVVFTAKHHAGFAMWDSKVTHFDIINTPYGKDVTKDLVNEAQKRGIKFYFYYSQPDWYEKLYRDKADHDRYVREFMYPQLTELLTQYGKIDGIWFDGLGKGIDTWYGPEMITMMRKLQPHLVVNHRWGNPPHRFGDFDGPERKIGRFQINRPWESCTIIGGNWGWTGDRPPMSFADVITLLAKTASRGGNLLLNTGPTGAGEILPSHAARFKDMGDWLKTHGESIYNTRGGPYIDGPWGGSTRHGKAIYLHLYGDMGTSLTLPDLNVAVISATILNGAKVAFTQNNKQLTIQLKEQPVAGTVIKLEMAKDISKLPVIPTINQAVTLSAKGSSSSDRNEKFSVKAMVEGSATSFSKGIHIRSSWSPSPKDKKPWLQLDLEKTQPIDYINFTSQSLGKLITRGDSYQVKFKIDGQWQTVHKAEQLLINNGIVLDKTYYASALRVEFSPSKHLNVSEFIAYSAR